MWKVNLQENKDYFDIIYGIFAVATVTVLYQKDQVHHKSLSPHQKVSHIQ